jgi:hypothetical protein
LTKNGLKEVSIGGLIVMGFKEYVERWGHIPDFPQKGQMIMMDAFRRMKEMEDPVEQYKVWKKIKRLVSRDYFIDNRLFM